MRGAGFITAAASTIPQFNEMASTNFCDQFASIYKQWKIVKVDIAMKRRYPVRFEFQKITTGGTDHNVGQNLVEQVWWWPWTGLDAPTQNPKVSPSAVAIGDNWVVRSIKPKWVARDQYSRNARVGGAFPEANTNIVIRKVPEPWQDFQLRTTVSSSLGGNLSTGRNNAYIPLGYTFVEANPEGTDVSLEVILQVHVAFRGRKPQRIYGIDTGGAMDGAGTIRSITDLPLDMNQPRSFADFSSGMTADELLEFGEGTRTTYDTNIDLPYSPLCPNWGS